MKKLAFFKIISWSLLAFVLISILVVTNVRGDVFENISIFRIEFNNFTNESQMEILRVDTFTAEDIDNLEIGWTSGTFRILATDGDEIVITQKSNKTLNEDELLQIVEEGNVLKINQGKTRTNFVLFGIGSTRTINEIKLPNKKYDAIITNFKSGRLEVENLNVETFKNTMTSGRVSATSFIADDLILEATSGGIDLTGEFQNMDIQATSGSIKVENTISPDKIDVDLTSGKVVLKIPENNGFRLSQNKTSGRISTDFEIDDFGNYKNGEAEYRVRVVSGKVELLRK